MFCFNLFVILLVDFHVYFGLLLSKRAHLKGSSENKATSPENFGRGHTPPLPPPHPPPSLHSSSLLRRTCVKRCFLNFAKIKGKHLSQSFFLNKVSGLKLAILLKKRLCHRCSPVDFANFLEQVFL